MTVAEPAILCLDSGTTRIKAAVYSAAGRLLGLAEADNTGLSREGPRITQDMALTRELNLDVAAAAIRQAGAPISAMIISAQGDGLWAVDAQHQPFMPGIVWLDSRARGTLRMLEETGAAAAIRQVTLSKPTTASQTVLLRWLAEHQPAEYRRIHKALRLREWLFLSLTGQLMAERSAVLAVWGDPRTGSLSPRVPELAGLDCGLSLVPELYDFRDCHAPIRADIARRLGVEQPFPVYVGPSDVQATAIGLGTGSRQGIDSCSVFGTGSIHVGYAPDPDHWSKLPTGSIIQPYALKPGFACLHAGFNGASIFRHIDRFTNSPDPGGPVRPAPSDLTVLPFFEEGGERAPVTSALLTGAVFGLQASTTPEQVRWAARESLAFMGRMSHEMFHSGPVVAVGGGLSQDADFMQFYADCLGRELRCFGSPNVGLFGLALLQLSVANPEAFALIARRAEADETTYYPDPTRRAEIDRKYHRFRTLTDLTLGWLEDEAATTRQAASTTLRSQG